MQFTEYTPIVEIINRDFRECEVPKGLIITDPPYNQNFKYTSYRDNLKFQDYVNLMRCIQPPCVIIHYPEATINILSRAMSVPCDEVVCWVYNSNTGKQSRLISWWGCKPDFTRIKQPYKNLNDKRIQERLKNGSTGARLYDWWEVNQVKNVSKEKMEFPCQIPEEIIRLIILTTAMSGLKIIDVFAGSGTTSKVASELGFDSVSYEMDSMSCEIIKRRINTNLIK